MWLTSEYKVIWRENLAIYHKSIKTFFQAPLQMKKLLTSGCTLMYCSMASSEVLQIWQTYPPLSAAWRKLSVWASSFENTSIIYKNEQEFHLRLNDKRTNKSWWTSVQVTIIPKINIFGQNKIISASTIQITRKRVRAWLLWSNSMVYVFCQR